MKKKPTPGRNKMIYIASGNEALIAQAEKQATKEGLSFSQYVIAGLRALLFGGKE